MTVPVFFVYNPGICAVHTARSRYICNTDVSLFSYPAPLLQLPVWILPFIGLLLPAVLAECSSSYILYLVFCPAGIRNRCTAARF